MKVVLKWVAVIVWALVGQMVGFILAQAYKLALEDTAGVVTARELLEIKVIPYIICAVFGVVAHRFTFNDN